MGRKMRASIDNREREAGMSYENTHTWIAGEDLIAGQPVMINKHGRAKRWVAYEVLTAAQMNQLSETIHGINAAIDKTVLSLTSFSEAMHVCPNCGGSKHHKGFRPWEECDGCGAEWSGE
jgi:hypothetical protein